MSQAPPLTVAQVRWLEHLAASLLEPYEKLVACILCYMLYARARNSDIARAASVLVDLAGDNQFGFGFVEAQVRNPKQKNRGSPWSLPFEVFAILPGDAAGCRPASP